MRNLKRALSLALAAAMLISLMVVGASAKSYKDQDAVSQAEAVQLLSDLGIVTGDQNGNFNPTATLTRAEFTVMMSNLLNGSKFDTTLFSGTDTPFTDVQGHWAAPYIAYCYSAGVIAGTSATTFSPDSTLTAAQAAAILLMALGYNQNSEFAANNQFALNVTAIAQRSGLYEDLSVAANSGVSRENVAQMLKNALFMVPQEYLATLQIYRDDPNGTLAHSLFNDVTPVTGVLTYAGGEDDTAIDNGSVKVTSDVADLGTIVVYYKDNDGLVSTAAVASKAATILGTSTSGDTLAKLSDRTEKCYIAQDDDTVQYIYNGDYLGTTISTAASTAVATRGTVVDLIDTDDNGRYDVVKITAKTVAKLTDDPSTRVSGEDTLVRVPGITGLSSFNANNTTETVVGYEGLKENDIVLWYQGANGYYYIEKAASFTGTLTALKGSDATIGGSTYKTSGLSGAMALDGCSALNTLYSDVATYYVDNGNNLVYAEGVEATTLAYVLDADTRPGDFDKNVEIAKLLDLTTGTVSVVTVKDDATALEGQFVEYTINDKDEYVLDEADAYAAGSKDGQEASGTIGEAVIAKGNPTVKLDDSTNLLANSNTVFLIRDYSAGATPTAKDTFTVYTGYTAVPSVSGLSDGSMVAYATSNGYATYVVLDPKENVTGSTSASDVFYVVDKTVTTLYDADGVSGYSIRAVMNGGTEIVNLEFAESPSVSDDGVYIAEAYNDDGQITEISARVTNGLNNEYVRGTGTGRGNNGTFSLAGNGYAYTNDTVVYFIDADNNLTVGTVADITDDADNKFVAIRASRETTSEAHNTIAVVFITEVLTDAAAPTAGIISGDTSAAPGDEKTYTVSGASGSGVLSYAWTITNDEGEVIATGTGSSITVTFETADTYKVNCTVTNTDASVDGDMTATADCTEVTVTVTGA